MPIASLLHPMSIPPPASSPSFSFPLKTLPQLLSIRFHSNNLPHPSLSPLRPQLSMASRHTDALEPAAAAPIVELDDEKYGKKQIISLTPQIYEYVLANVREPPVLRELREETAGMRGSQMQVSPDQAQLLAILVQILGAVKCIEIGVYTGYSSLAIALALPDSGYLVACERDANCLEIAKKYYERAGISHKVEIKHALAVDTLEQLIQNGECCSYDFAFVDAEKRMYDQYYELLLQLDIFVLELGARMQGSCVDLEGYIKEDSRVRFGGLIVFDNVLWHGKVSDPKVKDMKTISLRNFNKKILEDNRVSISMVPIGDGMTICRKRE